jgi:hypothetical protein
MCHLHRVHGGLKASGVCNDKTSLKGSSSSRLACKVGVGEL